MTIKDLKKHPKLVLLNSEGDILTAYKVDDKFYMVDEYKKTIGVLSEEELKKFIMGITTLTSTESEVMVYPSYSQGMRPNLEVIYKFIENK
jgi:hypothetical protein